MQPLVSVIIPTYKRADYLKRAIDSILNQTYSNVEVIVVDDNDPNTEYRKETAALMRSYLSYSNVVYICHPQNQNGAAARNTGIEHCSGQYVCFLDDDDWYLPEKISRQMHYLQTHPHHNAVYCGYERGGKTKSPYKEGDLSFELLSGVEIIYTNTIMMQRDCALTCGGWDERFRRNQEAVFLLRYFSHGGTIGVIPDILVKFDISDASNRSKPVQVEKDFDFYLTVHEKEIEKCCKQYPNAREMIYSYRYRGVFLNYLKYGYMKEAFSLYIRMAKKYPWRFPHDCYLYVKRRLLKQPLFKEFEK